MSVNLFHFHENIPAADSQHPALEIEKGQTIHVAAASAEHTRCGPGLFPCARRHSHANGIDLHVCARHDGALANAQSTEIKIGDAVVSSSLRSRVYHGTGLATPRTVNMYSGSLFRFGLTESSHSTGKSSSRCLPSSTCRRAP